MHFFVEAANYKEFEPCVNDVYLKHLFAETKIVNGLGEPEQWYSPAAARAVSAAQGAGRYRLRVHQQNQLRRRRSRGARLST